jgi:hypothetical protein
MATVLLFSGGVGGIGYREGEPKSGNFYVTFESVMHVQTSCCF